jgi:hypothetical protein
MCVSIYINKYIYIYIHCPASKSQPIPLHEGDQLGTAWAGFGAFAPHSLVALAPCFKSQSQMIGTVGQAITRRDDNNNQDIWLNNDSKSSNGSDRKSATGIFIINCNHDTTTTANSMMATSSGTKSAPLI